jgi:hypothetical protein
MMMMIFLKMRIIRVLEIPTFCLFFYTPPKKKQNKTKTKTNKHANKGAWGKLGRVSSEQFFL